LRLIAERVGPTGSKALPGREQKGEHMELWIILTSPLTIVGAIVLLGLLLAKMSEKLVGLLWGESDN
jgi:hypothetical protein